MQSSDRGRWTVPWLATALTLGLGVSLVAQAVTAAATRPVPVFDALLHKGKPDTRERGLVPIVWVGDLWRPGVSTESVDEGRVRTVFEGIGDKSGYYYIDIENWPLASVSESTRRETISKLTRLIDIGHRAAPHAHIGFYGLMPGIAYWPLMSHDERYDDWLAANRALSPLANHVDAVFPSLYTFYDDEAGWKRYARQTLEEARRYGKPVYVFLWPEFHDSNPELAGRQLSRSFWRAELDLCAELADGIVLWGGWKENWDESAPWWIETQAFMQAMNRGTDTGQIAPK